MKSSHLLILIVVSSLLWSITDLKKSYINYKNAPDYHTISAFYRNIGIIVFAIILFILYLFGYIKI